MRILGWTLLRSKAPAETLAIQLEGLDEKQFEVVIEDVQREFSRRYPAKDSNGSSRRKNGSALHIVPRSRRPSQRMCRHDLMDALLRGSEPRSPAADKRLADEDRLIGKAIASVFGQK